MSRIGFTIKAAAEVSAVDRSTIVRAVQDGRLRARQVEDQMVILRCDLESWLEGHPTYTVATPAESDVSLSR